MTIIDKINYAIWVYDNTCSTTIGFYKLTGADYKERLPLIVAFNKKMAGKIEVQDPMAWGAARASTWKAIVDNKFHLDKDLYAHLTPDGADMTDDDMRDYWIPGNDCGDKASAEDDQELLNQIGEMMGKEREAPPGHLEWVRGPKYEADTGGSYIKRDDTIMCLGCRTIAFEDEKVVGRWYVDKDHNLTRDLKATCAEERLQRVEDAKDLVATTEAEEEVHLERAQESGKPAVKAQTTPTMGPSKSAFMLAVMKADEALSMVDGAIARNYVPAASVLQQCEAAFFVAVDAGAAYVMEAKIDALLVAAKGDLNLMIDRKGLVVIYPGGGSRRVTVDDFDDNSFGTLSVIVDGEARTEMWSVRDALGVMKRYVGWKDRGDTTKAASTAAVPS